MNIWDRQNTQYKQISITDRNQFDNPVYSYQQGNSRTDDGTDSLLNNVQIKNILTRKNINNEKAKLGLSCCTDDEEDSCKGMKTIAINT